MKQNEWKQDSDISYKVPKHAGSSHPWEDFLYCVPFLLKNPPVPVLHTSQNHPKSDCLHPLPRKEREHSDPVLQCVAEVGSKPSSSHAYS